MECSEALVIQNISLGCLAELFIMEAENVHQVVLFCGDGEKYKVSSIVENSQISKEI